MAFFVLGLCVARLFCQYFAQACGDDFLVVFDEIGYGNAEGVCAAACPYGWIALPKFFDDLHCGFAQCGFIDCDVYAIAQAACVGREFGCDVGDVFQV